MEVGEGGGGVEVGEGSFYKSGTSVICQEQPCDS